MKRVPVHETRRQQVYRRDHYKCVYCRARLVDSELTIDHVVPVSKGGTNHLSNLVTACRACNCAKGSDLLLDSAALMKSAKKTFRKAQYEKSQARLDAKETWDNW